MRQENSWADGVRVRIRVNDQEAVLRESVATEGADEELARRCLQAPVQLQLWSSRRTEDLGVSSGKSVDQVVG